MKGKTESFKAAPSAMEAAKSAPKPEQKNKCGYDRCMGACPHAEPQKYYPEHTTVISRNTGKPHEISFGPQGNGLVPANPFASIAQQKFLHAHPDKVGGKEKLKEWDSASKGRSIPKRVK
jgi:hypothetical protein